jgi:hypothetical protein
MTISFKAAEFDNASEAIQELDAGGVYDRAITLDGRYFAVSLDEAHKLEATGVAFAYLHDFVRPEGSHRIMTVPVN